MRIIGWLKVGIVVAFGLTACSGSDSKGKKAKTAADPPKISADDKGRCDTKGKRVVRLDINQDKTADVWKLYSSKMESGAKVEALSCKEMDINFDGRRDVWIYYDDSGNRKMEEMDLDFDGKIDLVTIRQAGKVLRQEIDTDFDGKADIWKYFEEGKISRLDRDSNHNGKIDYWEYYEGGALHRIGYDKNGDGRVDVWDRSESTTAPTPAGGAKPEAETKPAETAATGSS